MAGAAQQLLLDGARTGDNAALGELLQQFRPYVRILVQSTWHRAAAARQDDSDLMQDTMVVVQEAFPRFRGTTVPEFAGWLRTLTLRTVGHAVRSQVLTGKRGVNREAILQDLDQLAMPEANEPEAAAQRHELAAHVAAALERLPADMQQVLRSRVFDACSYGELASRMQRTPGALRVLYTRALRRLGEELER